MLRLIGIGSPHGDDQIGWRLFQELAQLRRADIQTACLLEARLESGNWGDAAPLVPFGGPGATGGVLARFGRIGDASDGRIARVGRIDRSSQGCRCALRSARPKRRTVALRASV